MVRKSFPHSISHRLLEKRAMAVFIYFAFPGMASKTRPTSWYDRTSLFYFAIRKLTTEVFFIKMKCNDPNPKELFVVVVKILAYSWCCSIISFSLHSCHENATSRLYSTFIFSLKFTLSPHCSLLNEIVLYGSTLQVHSRIAFKFYKQTLPKEQRTKGIEYFDSFNTF